VGNGVAEELSSTIEQYLARARQSLEAIPANVHSRRLGALADYLGGQSRRLFQRAVPAEETGT